MWRQSECGAVGVDVAAAVAKQQHRLEAGPAQRGRVPTAPASAVLSTCLNAVTVHATPLLISRVPVLCMVLPLALVCGQVCGICRFRQDLGRQQQRRGRQQPSRSQQQRSAGRRVGGCG